MSGRAIRSTWWMGERLVVVVGRLRPRPDQPVEVAGLELVGVTGQQLQVGDAVVAGAGREDVGERQRGQGGEAARHCRRG